MQDLKGILVHTRVLIGTGCVRGEAHGWICSWCHNCYTCHSVRAILQLHHDSSVSQIIAVDRSDQSNLLRWSSINGDLYCGSVLILDGFYDVTLKYVHLKKKNLMI